MNQDNPTLTGLIYTLGISNHISGFRGFIPSFELNKLTLEEAILHMNNSTNKTGKKKYTLSKKSRKKLSECPKWLHQPLSQLLVGFAEANSYHNSAIRNIDPQVIESLFLQFDYTSIQNSVNNDYAFYDDLMDKIDEQALYFSSMLVMRSCEQFIAYVDSAMLENSFEDDFQYVFPTLLGDIIISGISDHKYSDEKALVIIDFGGNDTYKGAIASTSFGQPISVLID